MPNKGDQRVTTAARGPGLFPPEKRFQESEELEQQVTFPLETPEFDSYTAVM